MRVTRANVEKYAQEKGLHPVQINGIPEGFSFIEDPVTIGGLTYVGNYIGFIPLSDWVMVKSPIVKDFIKMYNEKKNVKRN